jgi:hypothetical protein
MAFAHVAFCGRNPRCVLLCAVCAASPPLAFGIHRNKMTKVISGNLKLLYRRSMITRNWAYIYFSEAVA